MRLRIEVAATIIFTLSAATGAEDWRQWRGPTGDNHAPAGATAPVNWSETKNIAWRTPIPGRGHSSPTLVGDRIYLTTANEQAKTQSLLVLDRATGRLLNQTLVHEGGFEPGIHGNNTYASQTVASDGERVFALFCNRGRALVTAFDLAGEQLWQTDAAPWAPRQYSFGYGTSPIYVDGRVIVMSEFDGPGSSITALDASTGEIAWRAPRPQNLSYSPPARYPSSDGARLLLSGNYLVAGYDPATGRELWSIPAPWQATCGSIVWDKTTGLCYSSGGGGGRTRNATYAVKIDGDHELAWENPVKCYESSMIVVDGYLYGVSHNVGVLYCWRCADGKQMWKERLGAGGAFSSSNLLVDGKIYLTSETGTTIVYAASPDGYKELARNQLGTIAFATPTPADGRLYHRYADDTSSERREYLVAIGP